MQIALDHTWEYIAGAKEDAPDLSDPQLPNWVIEDRNARWRIWLALSEDVQDTVILHTTSPASALFQALKSMYEYSGVVAEYYTCLTYKNAKVSDYDSLGDFVTGLMNLAHLVNKEVENANGRIQE